VFVRRGQRKAGSIRIGVPKRSPRGWWETTVSITPFYARLSSRGLDAFQSLMLAIQLAHDLVSDLASKGWRLHWRGSEFDSSTFFSLRIGSPARSSPKTPGERSAERRRPR